MHMSFSATLGVRELGFAMSRQPCQQPNAACESPLAGSSGFIATPQAKV